MSFLELAKSRFSARQYLDKPVEPEKLDIILEAGRVAPTACNLQPQKVLVVQSKEGLEKLQKAYPRFTSPLALIVYTDHEKSWKRKTDGFSSAYIDATIVTDHMMLAAADLGIDSVWVCAFDAKILAEAFPSPKNLEAVNILFLGYSDNLESNPNRHETTRKAKNETVVYENFSNFN